MAFDFNMAGLLGAASGFSRILLYALFIVWFVGVAMALWYLSGFKYKVRVRQLANDNRQIVVDDRARPFKDKDNIVRWRLLKHWQKVEVPPDEALDISKNGKVMVECYRTKNGNIIWMRAHFDIDVYKHDHPEFQPLTSEERSMQVRQMRAAQEYAKNVWSERLWMMAPSLILLVIFFGFMIFFGDVVAPTQEMAQTNVQTSEKLGEAVDSMKQICLERVTLQDASAEANPDLPSEPPN